MLRRVGHAIFVLLGVSVVVFALVRLTGDPASLFLPISATDAEREAFREQQGLNEPIIVQYLVFLGNAVRGDFGTSLISSSDAFQTVLQRVGPSLLLAAAALFITIVVGVPLGLLAAMRPGSAWDNSSRGVALVLQSTPSFFLGLLLILFISVRLGWLPVTGSPTLAGIILPALALGLHDVAQTTRLVRSSLLEQLRMDYVRTAKAKGLTRAAVLTRHALRNALIPVMTAWGLSLGFVFSRALVVEMLFAYPGVGFLLYNAITKRDFAVVQAAVVVIALMVVILNLAVDLMYKRLDPRVSLGAKAGR